MLLISCKGFKGSPFDLHQELSGLGTFGLGHLVWDIRAGTFGQGHLGRDLRAGLGRDFLRGTWEGTLGRDRLCAVL